MKVDDVDDEDNDPATDKYIELIWFDFMGNFPDLELPVALAEITFSTSTEAVDPITGQSISTTIRFTSDNTASGYEFYGESERLHAEPPE